MTEKRMTKEVRKMELSFLKIGQPYTSFDEEGYYIGCFQPLYTLYPDLPKGFLKDCPNDYFDYPFAKLKTLFNEFFSYNQNASIEKGDVAIFCFMTKNKQKVLHLGIMLDSERFFHSKKGKLSEIARLKVYKQFLVGFCREIKSL